MKIRVLNLSSIPNIEGFKFTGIGSQGDVYPNLEVKKNEFGQYYAIGYEKLFGWIRNDKNEFIK